MASLREKVEAELEQMDQALRLLPEARRNPYHRSRICFWELTTGAGWP